MAQVIWTKFALRDLDKIYDFIAIESVNYAQKTIEGFLNQVELLSHFPEVGRVIPEYLREDLREIIEGNYRIFYKVNKDQIFILRVHHAARQIKTKRK